MTEQFFIAILSIIGTLIGSFGGVLASAKLTNYRLEQLEKKVDKHNNFAIRMPELEHNYKSVNDRVTNIERMLINYENKIKK